MVKSQKHLGIHLTKRLEVQRAKTYISSMCLISLQRQRKEQALVESGPYHFKLDICDGSDELHLESAYFSSWGE